MGISSIIYLLGGLGLFLFGMNYMGEGLELAAGPKMKDLLEKLTRNRFMGFLLGALVTIVIQSSSATTVMVMGFINAGIMDLAQATGVIFGANVGTTITSVLIALDVSGIAPFCIFVGAAMMLYVKKKQVKYFGQVILGFGILFQGLHTMSEAMSPLKDYQPFQEFILTAKNPWIGLLVGVLICAVIQSSSAAVGVIQALAMQGLMPLHFAAFIVCGINVGSAVPVLISAINAKNNAKRAAYIYLIFNVVGMVIFMPLAMFTPITSLIEQYVAQPAFQISVFHILFKVVTGIVLLPLIRFVVSFTYKLVPKKAHESAFRLQYIDPNMTGSPAVMSLQVGKEVQRMANLVRDNLSLASESLIDGDISSLREIQEIEQVVDYLASEITDFITRANMQELPARVSQYLGDVFHVINDLEQIGDHAVKLSQQAEKCVDFQRFYSESAKNDLTYIYQEDLKLLNTVMKCFQKSEMSDNQWYEINKGERHIISSVSKAQTNHMERMQAGKCTFEQGLTFIESLNSLSRIVNHVSNIAEVAGNRHIEQMKINSQTR